MRENQFAYETVKYMMTNFTTWLQVKKLWPELMSFMHVLRDDYGHNLKNRIPDLRDVDASRARNPPPESVEFVSKRKRIAIPMLLQTRTLPELPKPMDMGQDTWDFYQTRSMYTMRRLRRQYGFEYTRPHLWQGPL